MKAYLINPLDRTITTVDYDGNYKSIHKLCDFDTFDVVGLTDDGDTLFVDDEGLIKGPVYQFFGIRGYPALLAGKALILGTDEDGNSIEPKHDITFYKARLCWIERLMGTVFGVTLFGKRKAQIAKLEVVEEFLTKPAKHS
jgi:hypothetical protein